MHEQPMIEESADQKKSMTESQRATFLQKPMERWKRNRSKPAELEDLRYRLIQARVACGLLATEAAKKFGYANSSQLSQIESGVRPTPSDWKFLKQAAEVYAVSVDWLLGLSPSMEQDSRVIREHALLRGTENLIRGFVAQMSSALIETAKQTNSTEEELTRVLGDVDDLAARFDKYAAQPAFEDMPGGAPVLAAVARLAVGVAPLRGKLGKLRAVEAALAELKSGNAISPAKYIEFFTERDEQAGRTLADAKA
ncbi:helix-turn-helix transcriptional regulator [Caballeronia sp. RCC_10]|uniref:helix-turn-helix domain-containing protein n=1 Tax=Caballeronia sp. RCC_10 TaxID=3239227 RepID=UPI003525A7D1